MFKMKNRFTNHVGQISGRREGGSGEAVLKNSVETARNLNNEQPVAQAINEIKI